MDTITSLVLVTYTVGRYDCILKNTNVKILPLGMYCVKKVIALRRFCKK